MINEEMMQQCCLLFEKEIFYHQPGIQILYRRKESPIRCEKGWTGDNCDSCATNSGPAGLCDSCLTGWAGDNCAECARGWAGDNCAECARGWAGDNCTECARGWAGDNCNECDRGWTGPDCDACAANFGPVGQCDSCLIGWTGENCTEFLVINRPWNRRRNRP